MVCSVLRLRYKIEKNEIWTALDREKKEWEDLISSKEWRLTENHFSLCESRIAEKTLALYKEGSLPLRIDEDANIGRGIDAYFADLNRFTSNQQRLRHLQQVHACIGNPKSPIWR